MSISPQVVVVAERLLALQKTLCYYYHFYYSRTYRHEAIICNKLLRIQLQRHYRSITNTLFKDTRIFWSITIGFNYMALCGNSLTLTKISLKDTSSSFQDNESFRKNMFLVATKYWIIFTIPLHYSETRTNRPFSIVT